MTKRLNVWSTVFKGLGNSNRLRILEILSKRKEISVTELTELLRISFKNTSRNLGILCNLGLIESIGKKGKVYYSMSADLDADIKALLALTFKK